MNIIEAMKLCSKGYSIKRKSQYWLYSMNKDYADNASFSLDIDSILATDWELADGHDFAWAVEQMECGKKVCRVTWDDPCNRFIYLYNTIVHFTDKGRYLPYIKDLKANDWVEYKGDDE